ncbi:lipoprotein [Klebsiella pneumoniae]|nr:lipoprotein [Klebsiella pneumoniae]
MRKIFSCALRKNYQQRALYYEIWNLEKRPEELDIIRSQIKKAQSAESQVKRQLGRYRNLYANHAISLAEWEDIRDELTQKGAQVEELINQLKARKLPARQDEISKQRSMVAAAKLERDKALVGCPANDDCFSRSMLKSSILFIVPGSALLLVNQ